MDSLNAALADRYQIEHELGQGGMATVYLARDLRHNRQVALKVLKPELAAVVGAERFLAEIETTANLQHPNILPLFDSGEADGVLYYVMPFVDGETLGDRLERESQLPVEEAVRIATEAAEALQAAHEQGVIHRDIKPANILLSRGRPLVADFGIALAVSAAGGGRLTETGLSLGTPHYMSPEQASTDRDPSPASDVYSLGCVLYEMLVGEPPYTGASAQVVLTKILTADTPIPTESRASIPANVDAAIRKALEKLPADRFPGAQDFAKALADPGFRHGELADAGIEAAVTLWKRLTVGFAAATIAFAGVAVWSLLRPEPPTPAIHSEVTPTQGSVLVGAGGVDFALSPDGERMIYVGEGPEGRQLWERRFDALEPTPIEGTQGASGPVFSPDGSSILFMDATTAPLSLKTISLPDGLPFTLLDGLAGWNPYHDWSSDGLAYYTQGPNVYSVPATGGQPRQVTEEVEGVFTRNPHVLPNGRGLLVTLMKEWPDTTAVGVVDPERGEIRELFPGINAQYTASGHIVYGTVQNRLMAAPFDLDRLEVTGTPVSLLQGLLVDERRGWAHFAISDAGLLVYQAAGTGIEYQPVWVDRNGRETQIDPEWTFRASLQLASLALSPEDDRLAVSILPEAGGALDIWVKDLRDLRPLSRLTFDGRGNRRPSWSADGEYLTFDHQAVSGESEARRKRADGTGEVAIVAQAPGLTQARFSPDGEWLVYRAGPDSNMDIFALRVGSDSVGHALLAEDHNEDSPVLSPDGRWLAYGSDETGRWEVFVRPFPDVDSGKSQVSTSGGTDPVWSHDGSELFYRNGVDELISVEVVYDPTFSPGQQRALFSVAEYLGGGSNPMYDVSSDDQRFLMLKTVAVRPDRLILVQNFFEELTRLAPN